MTPPRTTVRNYWLAKLAEIKPTNGYQNEVRTVELRSGLARDLNTSDYPAIIITQGADIPYMAETLGNNQGNNYFREMALDLHLVILDQDNPAAVQDAGEKLISDVIRCLILNRFSNSKPSDARLDTIVPHEFERIENKRAEITLRMITRYDFTLGDLS